MPVTFSNTGARRLSSAYVCFHCMPILEMAPPSRRCYSCFACMTLPEVSSRDATLCALCAELQSPLFRQRYLWEYTGKARDLIIAMKFKPSIALARMIAELLAVNLPRLFNYKYGWEAIIPMPSTPRNYRKRLFNPAREIAEHLAQTLGIPCRSDMLQHSSQNVSQASQKALARLEHARRSIVLNRADERLSHALLVDDVVTSGATSSVAAYLLTAAGIPVFDLLSVARSPRWQSLRRLIASPSQAQRARC